MLNPGHWTMQWDEFGHALLALLGALLTSPWLASDMYIQECSDVKAKGFEECQSHKYSIIFQ